MQYFCQIVNTQKKGNFCVEDKLEMSSVCNSFHDTRGCRRGSADELYCLENMCAFFNFFFFFKYTVSWKETVASAHCNKALVRCAAAVL